jgi:hypothetical protein
MPFEKFSGTLNKAFQILDKDPDEALTDRQKVDKLDERIKTTDPELIAAKVNITTNFPADFSGAISYFSAAVSRIHGSVQLENRVYQDRKRGRRVSGLNRGRGRFRRNHNADWSEFYGDVEEEMPPNMPEPRGNPVSTSAFVDANHAGNVVTRRSHTGIILFVQNAPIMWYSKRQNTVESATFGSEFVALRTCKDLIVSLRYKLRMFGVQVDGPTNVFCDNRGVVKNSSVPESTLMKKHNAINYHAVREAAAADILRVGKEDTATNFSDLLTKIITGQRRWDLCYALFW